VRVGCALNANQIATKPHSAWQALTVLAPFVHADILPAVNARLYEDLKMVTMPQVRWHMEMLNAYLCMRYPSVGVPLLIEHVATVDMRPQFSASLLVVVGHLCLTKDTLFGGDGQLPEAFVLPVLKVVLPWLSGEREAGAGWVEIIVCGPTHRTRLHCHDRSQAPTSRRASSARWWPFASSRAHGSRACCRVPAAGWTTPT
jgi:hypothetical protein